MTKIYYNYNKEGYYTTSREARKSPLEKVILFPALLRFTELDKKKFPPKLIIKLLQRGSI